MPAGLACLEPDGHHPRVRQTCAVVLLLLATACGGASSGAAREEPAPRASAPSGGAPLRFDWSPPCRVPVTQTIEHDGHRATVTREIVVRTTADPQLLEVATENVQLIDIDGQPASSARPSDKFATTLVLALAAPTMVVDVNGVWKSTHDVDAVVARLQRAPAFAKLRSPTIDAFLTSPGVAQQLASRLADSWNAWVGFWLDSQPAPGTTLESEMLIPLADGSQAQFPVVVRHHGELAEAPGRVRLTFESTIDGENGIKVLGKQFAGVLADPRFPKGTHLTAARRTTSADVVTDPLTLRPERARYVGDLSVSLSVGVTHTRHEAREDVFDWSKAEGCGK